MHNVKTLYSTMDLAKFNFYKSSKLVGIKNYPIWSFIVEQILCANNVEDISMLIASSISLSFKYNGSSSISNGAFFNQVVIIAIATIAIATTIKVQIVQKKVDKANMIITFTISKKIVFIVK